LTNTATYDIIYIDQKKEVIKMEITKNFIYTHTVVVKFDDNNLVKLRYNYINDGKWEFTTYYANRPTAKIFKGWEYISILIVDGDGYRTIPEMLFDVAENTCLKVKKDRLIAERRSKKWDDFVKESLDKHPKV
jgi:hypothetical protein